MEPLQHVFIDNGKLLDRVIDTNRLFGQAKEAAQSRIGHRGDSRRTVTGQVNRHTVRLLVVQGGKDSFT